MGYIFYQIILIILACFASSYLLKQTPSFLASFLKMSRVFQAFLSFLQKFNKSGGCNKIRGKFPGLFYPGIAERRDERK
jgi:hypothetical protein